MAKVHFVTGKGGVGKSSVAAAMASHLEKSGEGPVLLLELQGSGHSLQLLKVEKIQFANTHVPGHSNLWAARILPKESFKQYFEVLVGLSGQSALAAAASAFKERLVDLVIENKIVSAFIDVCPGLEPAVLLGKVHWEATKGRTPEEELPWAHIVVDAPATGHGVMLFRSTFALSEVFTKGVVFRQAADIANFVKDPQNFYIYVVTTAEELPLKESQEMMGSLEKLGLPFAKVIVNRHAELRPPDNEAAVAQNLDRDWNREVAFEREALHESKDLLQKFFATLPSTNTKFYLPEIVSADDERFVAQLRSELRKQFA